MVINSPHPIRLITVRVHNDGPNNGIIESPSMLQMDHSNCRNGTLWLVAILMRATLYLLMSRIFPLLGICAGLCADIDHIWKSQAHVSDPRVWSQMAAHISVVFSHQTNLFQSVQLTWRYQAGAIVRLGIYLDKSGAPRIQN